MTIFTLLSQLVQRFHRQRPQPPPDVEAAPQAQPNGLDVNNHIRDLANIMVNFCLVWAPAMALIYAQIQSKYSPTLHLISFEFLLCFASFFVSKFMNSKFPVIAQVLDLVGVFFVGTAFFTVITIPFLCASKLSLGCSMPL
ncbi:hypothetical protein FH972_002610 [Carpinus fangiana]|uniref:Uncharacterized protein n=1 Tax=Carpinus fangiana TaxID=176857 RepID=A0A5N6QHS7_9ROSI|nr:hypothetical protein FH972_002610 [Carpinus fangiana]